MRKLVNFSSRKGLTQALQMFKVCKRFKILVLSVTLGESKNIFLVAIKKCCSGLHAFLSVNELTQYFIDIHSLWKFRNQ